MSPPISRSYQDVPRSTAGLVGGCILGTVVSHFRQNTVFSPLLPNGISRLYQLDRSVSVLRVVGCFFFHFYSNFNITFFQQTVETLIRRRVLRRLIWVCTACLCPTKRALGLYGLSLIMPPLSHAPGGIGCK